MRNDDPSTDVQIVRSLEYTLKELVLPSTTDDWAASYLRSALSLVSVLEARLLNAAAAQSWEAEQLTSLIAEISDELGSDSGTAKTVGTGEHDLDTLREAFEELVERSYRDDTCPTVAIRIHTRLAQHRCETITRYERIWCAASKLEQL